MYGMKDYSSSNKYPPKFIEPSINKYADEKNENCKELFACVLIFPVNFKQPIDSVICSNPDRK